MAVPSTVANYKQHAAAELQIGLGHLRAARELWSPGTGLSPSEEREDSEVQAWRRFSHLIEELATFEREEGPGA